jgi:cobyrinic acid a,c-diamide synthase
MVQSPLVAFMLAAPSSGSGKTLASLLFAHKLRKAGLTLQTFKVGPDFIDPIHLTRVSGRPCIQLDRFFLGDKQLKGLFARHSEGAGAVLVEGTMGLFDGSLGGKPDTSSAAIAKLLGLRVVLVVDVAKMARSAAALIHGFSSYDPDVRLLGVVLNRVAGKRHAEAIVGEVEGTLKVPVLGSLPKLAAPPILERHLGLHLAHETDYGFLETLSPFVSSPEKIEARLGSRALPLLSGLQKRPRTVPTPKFKLGVVRDEAFLFYYEENLAFLTEIGIELVFFSPLNDRTLPKGLDGLYLGGGYPELFAGRLSKNEPMLRDIRAFTSSGRPVYAECGGMALLASTLLIKGERYPMAGALDTSVEFPAASKRMGYRRVRLRHGCLFGKAGDELLGHEFHYSGLLGGAQEKAAPYELFDSSGEMLGYEGIAQKNVLASYVHLYFRATPQHTKAAFLSALARSA